MGTPLPCPGSFLCRLAAVVVALATLAAAPSGAAAADPVVMAAGDIACNAPGRSTPGDCSQIYTSNLALFQQSSPEGLAALLAAGDTQYETGTLAEYQQFFTPSWGRAALRGVLRPALGNHEYDTSGASGYFNYFASIGVNVGARGQGWYSFDVGDWHLVALNSSDECRIVSCAAGSPQETWLRADLASTQKSCVLAYWHHPIGTMTAGRPIFSALYGAGVDIVLAGHTHTYRSPRRVNADGGPDPGGPYEVVVGTGGKSGGIYGLLKLTLHAGSADYEFVGSGSSDRGTMTCRGGAPPPPPPPPPPKPVASFTATSSGLTARFTDTSTNTPTSWTWTFGDGTGVGASDPTPDPVHTYARAGTYTVQLTAGNRGGSSTTRRTITVSPLPATPSPTIPPGGPPAPAPDAGVLSPIPGPPPIVVAPDRRLSSVTTRRARSIVRGAARTRLRRWTLTSVTCRTAGRRKATCRFRAKLGGRRISATGTVTLSSTGRSLGYRFTVRYVKGPRRTSTWVGRARV